LGKARKPQRKEYGTVAPELARGANDLRISRAAPTKNAPSQKDCL
jgi:hypothetical protein